MTADFGVNQGLVEEQFLKWVDNPLAVDESWRAYFESLAPTDWPQISSAGTIMAPVTATGLPSPAPLPSDGNGSTAPAAPHPVALVDGVEVEEGVRNSVLLPPTAETTLEPILPEPRTSFPPSSELLAANELQARLSALINAYRVRGHLYADLDPLGLHRKPPEDEFVLKRYGLAHVDPETIFATGNLAGPPNESLRSVLSRLKDTYSRTIGVEFTFLENQEARDWLRDRMELSGNHIDLSREQQVRILTKLTDAEIFEQFLHTKYTGAKRFSLEGGESVIPMLDILTERASELGVEEMAIGMAHRGRLNVMVNIMEMNVRQIFAGFEDDDPEKYVGTGDVKYHLGYSLDRKTASGNSMHMTLAFNPSHLEFVNPVVEGRVRAKQDRKGDHDRLTVLPLLIHGDAAFVGQGVVAETLNLSRLPAYETGGTIHVVINNQIGFTTNPEDSRSTAYCTDITRMLRCPVFHVNGEDPEAVAQAVTLATEYRQRFHGDVVLDLFCYRKYGHNEGDEPRFTQPEMYEAIDRKKTVREVYIDHLVKTGKLSTEQADTIKVQRQQDLERALEDTRKNGNYDLIPASMLGLWTEFRGGSDLDVPDADTRFPKAKLIDALGKLTSYPDWFTPHPRIKRFVLDKQTKVMETGEGVDWGTAENLAFASLLLDGVRCRLTGQDVRRGTFSHRHAVIFDETSGRRYTRLGHLSADQAHLEIYDSPLSEVGVLGFEWGYSLDSPDALVCWEAQFGDFVNVAQVIIDQFISSSEDKWQRLSGLVMLLPHGMEGQGPEHSSARLERFLLLCAEDNMQVVNLTTPAQLFHCLRRQVLRPWRKPLIVMSPKSLLRHRRAVSTLDELAEGSFQRIIPDDPAVEPSKVRRVVLCTGKIYYDLLERREQTNADDIAIIRVEQVYPLRASELQTRLAPYPKDVDLVWVQEEPWNMGAWFFMRARLPEILGAEQPLRCVARPESASPATGSGAAHKLEQRLLVDEVFH
ncbi:MAG: 2-oxoglutarate dehydrogenase E1 component [Deltaproteobacteria bacterium]|nr:2-oxoglutarate dehydrogenase E1 component [Deltaproteobacteria bacterium]NND30698.1 2-oxoglutarate dehydrogenase E1 component [Myxococcales bacterium]MBT8466355.1 2-oxoglutarate dehydrogenase E1 component [Deltaproteobacteria bacterium]MBT8482718.1 2-oxoglutarate dehydrogenase E1 component [Deltaproteobacteria bacterium]NNK08172.1 2-oxoglutarate dehydrogenase E1 component [Myxococcales bacterium]